MTKEDKQVFLNELEAANEQIKSFKNIPLKSIEKIKRPKEKIKSELIEIDSKILKEINSLKDQLMSSSEKLDIIQVGSFQLPSGYFTRYQIKTHHILSQSSTLNSITDIFQKIYNNSDIDYVIGIDKAGIILAPNLGLKLRRSFSYAIINDVDRKISNSMELDIRLAEKKSVLLITDTIASGSTIEKSILMIKERFKPARIHVCSVFSTNNIFFNSLQEKFPDIQFIFLINSLQFELFSEGQLAKNKILKSEFDLLTNK